MGSKVCPEPVARELPSAGGVDDFAVDPERSRHSGCGHRRIAVHLTRASGTLLKWDRLGGVDVDDNGVDAAIQGVEGALEVSRP
jgi:hypothetical protein